MTEVARIPTNAGDLDYRAAINRLEWSVWHAEQLGFVMPSEVTAALAILRGEACVTYFSNASASPIILCVGRPETDEDFDDHLEMVEFVCDRLKRRRQRALEKKADTVIGYRWPANA